MNNLQKDTVTINRDLLESLRDNTMELMSERDWWKQEPRCGYNETYARYCSEIDQVDAILEATEADKPDTAESCENCRFWRRPKDGILHGYGYCRRYSPGRCDDSHFPLSKKNEWCGEYQKQ